MKQISTGIGVMDFYIEGKAIIVDDPQEAIGKCYGRIIVAKAPTPDIALVVREAAGIVTQSGGLTCHVALVCLEMGKPAIVGATEILSAVKDEMEIVIESVNHKGAIYEADKI